MKDTQSLSKKAKLLHLTSIALANGMKTGSFKSLYKGQGIEFFGVREYMIGDDIRAIDWNVSSRIGKTYVKTFNEERELDVFIVLDKSMSMNTGSGRCTRLETASDCASILTLASLKNSSPVGAITFDGAIDFSCKPISGKNHALMLLSKFEHMDEHQTTGSVLTKALAGAARLLRKKSLVFIISDFRSAGWDVPFAHLCSKNDVIAIRICDDLDTNLPKIGTAPFRDNETGHFFKLPLSSPKFSSYWNDSNTKKIEAWKKYCLKHGATPLCINTSQDPSSELIKFFKGRKAN